MTAYASRPRLSWLEIFFILNLLILFFHYLYFMFIFSEDTYLNSKTLPGLLFLIVIVISYLSFILLGIIGTVRGNTCMVWSFAVFIIVYLIISLLNITNGAHLIGHVIGIAYAISLIIIAIYFGIVYLRPPYTKENVTVVYQI